MNKNYKKGKRNMKKLLSTALAAGIFISMNATPIFAVDTIDANQLPSFNHGTNVDVTTRNGNKMNIQIDPENQSQYAVGTAYWNSFHIGKDATVNVEFTAHNQTSLNYVDQAGGMSQIYGNFLNSGCNGCGYAGTGKVILLNPNGVFFGNGANVDLNSFTASSMNGTYDQNTKTLTLLKTGKENEGIVVEDGATIKGDKNVAFASENIRIYNGSQISTNIGDVNAVDNNGADVSIGKVKLVTSDGVNFKYYNNQAIEEVQDVNVSDDKMTLFIGGDIKSGHIDARNASTNVESELNTNGAVLKAYKAENGSDGNIWLTSNNRVITENTTLNTLNATDNAKNVTGGNVLISSKNKSTLTNDTVDAVGNVTVKTTLGNGYAYTDAEGEARTNNGDVIIDGTSVNGKNITVDSVNIASVQNKSSLNGTNITITGKERAQVSSASTVNADNFDITGNNVWFDRADISATNKINAKANTGYVLSSNKGVTKLAADDIVIDAATNVTGPYDLQNNKTTIKAGNDIDVTLSNVSNPDKGLVAQAGKNVTIATDGDLSVGSLIAQEGDMTLTADKIKAGRPYTSEPQIVGDEADRSYIYVANGKFTSNTANDSYKETASDTFINNNTQTLRHHIEYGDSTQKILLINPWDYVAPAPQEEQVQAAVAALPNVNDNQASMLHKIPRQPEAFNDKTEIVNNRASFVDVFAAASQIEVDDDEY